MGYDFSLFNEYESENKIDMEEFKKKFVKETLNLFIDSDYKEF